MDIFVSMVWDEYSAGKKMNIKNYHIYRWLGSLTYRWLVLISISTYLPINLSTYFYGASEKPPWSDYPKWLTGSDTLGDWAIKANSGTWDGSNWVIEISTENPQTAFFPGRDYYYLYQTTTPALVWDQRERGKSLDSWQPWKSERYIYLPILGVDVVLANGTTYYPLDDYVIWYGSYSIDSGYWEVYDNWGGGNTEDDRAGPPLPPVSLTGEMIYQPTGIEAVIQWTAPTFQELDILDLTNGGGYEIWRSSSPEFILGKVSASTLTFTKIAENLGPAPPLEYTDTGLSQNTTYYYCLKSYDAYIPSDYSAFSEVLTLYGVALPVDITFNVDITGYSADKVFVFGDFTNQKYLMKDNKNNTWTVKVPNSESPLKLLVGKTVKYRYLKNDDWEPYERTVLLTSTDTVLNDIWGVDTVTSTPAGLPEEIVSFRSEPVGSYSKNLLWETDPKELQNIFGYEIQYSTFSNFLSSSTITILYGNTSSYFLTADAEWFKFSIIYKDGSKSKQSDAIQKGAEVPSLVACLDASPIDNLVAKTGANTGEIILSWKAPQSSPAMGTAHHYIIRRATFPMTDIVSFKKRIITGKAKAHYTGNDEWYITINLGESCPGYYFGVEAIYGNWKAATVSNAAVGVAGKFLVMKKGGITEKAVKSLGGETDAGVEQYAVKPNIEIKKYGTSLPNAIFVVKNSIEINKTVQLELKDKLDSAVSPSLQSQKRLKFPSANLDLENKDSTVFEFSSLSQSGSKLFSDAENVNLPFIVSIPYSQLDKDNDGIVDSSKGTQQQIKVADLRVYRLNEKYNFWQRIKDGQNYVDTTNKLVKAETKHLSVFCLAAPGNAATDLSNVVVFPNPFKPYDGKAETGSYDTGIIFTNLTPTAEIFIYTIAAELVKKHKMEGITDDEKEGKWKWDVRNDDGERLASGVYIFVVKDENVKVGKDKFVGKLCVIR